MTQSHVILSPRTISGAHEAREAASNLGRILRTAGVGQLSWQQLPRAVTIAAGTLLQSCERVELDARILPGDEHTVVEVRLRAARAPSAPPDLSGYLRRLVAGTEIVEHDAGIDILLRSSPAPAHVGKRLRAAGRSAQEPMDAAQTEVEALYRQPELSRAQLADAEARLGRFVPALCARNEVLERENAELDDARRSAQEASEQKTRFVSNMSHEMRTPLNGVLGMTTLLAERFTDPEDHEQLDVIRSSGEQLLRLIDELLDLSRIESGVMLLDDVPFDLKTLADEIIALLESKFAFKQVGLSLEVAGPTAMIADAGRVRQVLINLIDNAMKFTPAGEVAVAISGEPDDPRPGEEVFVTCRVADDGPGVSLDQHESIFAPFVQVDDSLARSHGGAGLGLAIARSLARRLGGDIAVRSDPGAGAEFTFTFRAQATDESETAALRAPWAWDKTMAQRHPLRILIADDSSANLLVAKAMLQRLGYAPDAVGNGREAVQAVATTHYDIVLMDVQMPEMDGLEATYEIGRARSLERRPRIVGLSAGASEGEREAGLRAGMTSYLSKPIVPEHLVQELDRTPARGPSTSTVEDRAERQPSAAPTADAHDRAQIVDAERLAELSELFGSDLAGVIDEWHGEAVLDVQRIGEALEEGDTELARVTAHGLKGASATLGASEVALRAARLEDLSRGQLPIEHHVVAELAACIERTREEYLKGLDHSQT